MAIHFQFQPTFNQFQQRFILMIYCDFIEIRWRLSIVVRNGDFDSFNNLLFVDCFDLLLNSFCLPKAGCAFE